MKHILPLLLLVSFFCIPRIVSAAPPVHHPNLLLNRAEIAAVQAKIHQYPWAANLLAKVKEAADVDTAPEYNLREQALYYALSGERAYADKARARLLGQARGELPKYEAAGSTYGYDSWQSPWDGYAWAYDLTYDTFSNEERQTVERWLYDAAKAVLLGTKQNGTTPNLMFVMHFNVGIVGYCLGNQELIDWALNDPGLFGAQRGGFYPVMDSVIKDGQFWGEAPLYGLDVDLWGMLALAEAALHYDGTDLYHYVSKKNGASLKGLLDGYLRMGFPLERTGIRGGALRIATFGDGLTTYGPRGTMRDEYLTDNFFLGALEIGYKRYHDPAYPWVLSLNPQRDADLGMRAGRQTVRASLWGFIALTHGEPLPEHPTPPPAPSGVYPEQGFAMLRADESPNFWSAGSLAAMLKLGNNISHGHSDYYELVLHGKGRLLYPDIQIVGYEPTYLGWTHDGVGHSTLVVDGQSPRSGPFTTLHDFTPEVKFTAITGSAFDGVTQTRRLLLTKEYLADIFHAADPAQQEHVYDWVLHGLGRLYPGNPGAFHATDALLPYYWWVDNERSRETEKSWQMDWIQRSAGITPGVQFTPEWFDHETGVRLTMLGTAGTRVHYGDGPLVNGPPYDLIDGNTEGSVPMTVVRRQTAATTFAAVHEPYVGAPRLQQVSRLAETPQAIALAISAADFTDYLMTAFDDQPHTLTTPAGEAFTFTDYGYLRVAGGKIIARGKLTAIRLSGKQQQFTGGQDDRAPRRVTLNGRSQALRRQGAFLQLGEFPTMLPPAGQATATEDPSERSAALHYFFLPAEVHLSAEKAGDAREIEVHLRAVGPGEVKGTIQIAVPAGVSVTPARLDIAPLREGEERVIRLTVRVAEKAQKGLFPLTFTPEMGMLAARQTLMSSVGVMMTLDRRIPEKMQYIIRAPGYTMKVDVRSGVSYYLLDADGHRRHGELYGTNFCSGFPSVGNARYGNPCAFVWEGNNALTIGSDPTRLHYTFYEDCIVFSLIPPTDPQKTFSMWLGNFEALNPPVFNGKPEAGHQFYTNVADWFFFPHPIFRQGILIITPPQTPLSYAGSAVNFPIKAGQEVTLKFATPEEVELMK